MKAVVLDENGLTVRDDYPVAEPATGEALVRVRCAGICGTDIELTKGYMGFRGVPGHEFVGIVERATNPALAGKRVVGEINCACHACPTCSAGWPKHCPNRTVLGIDGRDGAFAEYLVLPERNLHAVAPETSDRAAVFAEPLAAAFEIAEHGVALSGADAVVLGDGKLGLLVAQVLLLSGARVCAVGRHPEKLRIVADYGATVSTEPPASRSADVVVEATGSADGLAQALDVVRPRGTVFLKTTIASDVAFNLSKAVVDEITLIGSRCGPFAPALEALAAGRVRVDDLVEAEFPLDDAPEAFDQRGPAGCDESPSADRR